MKKTILFLWMYACACLTLHAQKSPFKFGEISIKDLEMTVYPKDSGAAAVVLLDYGDIRFDESDFGMYMVAHMRIKILKEEGFDWADVSVNYLKEEGNINKLKAATYNLIDGKVVTTEVPKRAWVEEKENSNWRVKKLSFPDVKVGSIIEYSYAVKRGDFYSLPGWNFQTSIPVRHSEYKIQIPQYGEYQSKFRGYIAPSVFNRPNGNYHIIMRDVPALKKEPYVATMENFRSSISFEIKSINVPGYISKTYMENWGAINKELMQDEDFGRAIKSKGLVKKLIPENSQWSNDEESLIEIYNYVKDHYTWDKNYGYILTKKPKESWQEGEADAGDINLTLLMFLRSAGIKADPVILSTRKNGYIDPTVPLVRQFNYTIACATIGDKKYLLDATDPLRPYDVLPERCLNGRGLIISENGPQWIDLHTNQEVEGKTVSVHMKVNELDEVEGKVDLVYRKLSAVDYRNMFKDVPADEFQNTFENHFGEGEISDFEIKNLDDPHKPVKISYSFVNEDNLNMITDRVFFSPVVAKEIDENPFKLEKRIYPVEFTAPIVNTYLFHFEIPEGYEVEELPEQKSFVLPDGGGRYMYMVGAQGRKIQVVIRLNIKKITYLPEEYPTLKELFNLIIAKQEEQIVLKKSIE